MLFVVMSCSKEEHERAQRDMHHVPMEHVAGSFEAPTWKAAKRTLAERIRLGIHNVGSYVILPPKKNEER
jgi:hypothetical protein